LPQGAGGQTIFLSPVLLVEIVKIINSFASKKSRGHDDIPLNTVKCSATVIALIMSVFANKIFKLGIFPSSLKIAKVIPIFKSNDKKSMNNYRTIFLLTCFSKIFEKLIDDRLMNFFEKNSIFVSTQYGFRAKHNTAHAILDVASSTYDNINNNEYTGLIMLDLTAFDTVCHKELLTKLSHYGIRGKAFDLLHSYLSNRQQYTYINGFSSALQKFNVVLLRVRC